MARPGPMFFRFHVELCQHLRILLSQVLTWSTLDRFDEGIPGARFRQSVQLLYENLEITVRPPDGQNAALWAISSHLGHVAFGPIFSYLKECRCMTCANAGTVFLEHLAKELIEREYFDLGHVVRLGISTTEDVIPIEPCHIHRTQEEDDGEGDEDQAGASGDPELQEGPRWNLGDWPGA